MAVQTFKTQIVGTRRILRTYDPSTSLLLLLQLKSGMDILDIKGWLNKEAAILKASGMTCWHLAITLSNPPTVSINNH